MNTNEIYEYTNFRESLDILYRKFHKKIDKDKNFNLTDNEIFELFIDLLMEYKKEYIENFDTVYITKINY